MNLLISSINHVLSATVTAGQSHAGNMTYLNLKNTQPGRRWSPNPTGGAQTESYVDIDNGSSKPWNTVGLGACEYFTTAAEWRVYADTTQAGLGVGAILDTGWMPIFGGLSPTKRAKLNAIYYAGARTERWQRLSVRDPDAETTDFIRIGILWIGDAWVLTRNAFKEKLPTRVEPKKRLRLEGGAKHLIQTTGETRLRYTMKLDWSERQNLDDVYNNAGTSRPVLTHLNATIAAPESSDWFCYGPLDEPELHDAEPDKKTNERISQEEML